MKANIEEKTIANEIRFTLLDRIAISLVLIVFLLQATVFDEARLPVIGTGLFSVHIVDIVLLSLIPLGFSRRLKRSMVSTPILILMCYAVFSALYGLVTGNTDFNHSMRGLRTFSYYIVFFVVVGRAYSPKSARILLRGLVILAIVTSLGMIIQYVVGEGIQILPRRVETLRTDGIEMAGVTRILPPGQTLVFFVFTVAIARLLFNRNADWKKEDILIALLTGSGVLLTFNRSYWIGVTIAVFALGVFGERRRVLLGVACLIVFVTMVALFTNLFPDNRLAIAFSDRAITLLKPADVLEEGSLQGRLAEQKMAWARFSESPILGLGIGASWNKAKLRFDSTGYMHNGYMWVLTKMGVIGGVFFLILMVCLTRVFFSHPRSYVKDIGLFYGCFAFLLAVMLGNIVNPMLWQKFSVPVIATAMALGENCARLARS